MAKNRKINNAVQQNGAQNQDNFNAEFAEETNSMKPAGKATNAAQKNTNNQA